MTKNTWWRDNEFSCQTPNRDVDVYYAFVDVLAGDEWLMTVIAQWCNCIVHTEQDEDIPIGHIYGLELYIVGQL